MFTLFQLRANPSVLFLSHVIPWTMPALDIPRSKHCMVQICCRWEKPPVVSNNQPNNQTNKQAKQNKYIVLTWYQNTLSIWFQNINNTFSYPATSDLTNSVAHPYNSSNHPYHSIIITNLLPIGDSIAANLVSIIFKNLSFGSGGSLEPITKKLPSSLTVGRLRGMVKQLFGLVST